MQNSAIFILSTLLIVSSVAGIDNEYCSLNLSVEDCTQNTKLTDCCHVEMEHDKGYPTLNVKSCFAVDFIVRGLKFMTDFKGFERMTDSELCKKLGGECSNITTNNVKSVLEMAAKNTETTKIKNIVSVKCHGQ